MVNSAYQRSITIKKNCHPESYKNNKKNHNYRINYGRLGLARNLFGDLIKILDSIQLKLMSSSKFV